MKLGRSVTPFAGVWIEIKMILDGTKIKWSLPSRECGLKFRSPVYPCPGRRVTPFAGVWIEIEKMDKEKKAIEVTPFAGVWIEIRLKREEFEKLGRHSLRGSVD